MINSPEVRPSSRIIHDNREFFNSLTVSGIRKIAVKVDYLVGFINPMMWWDSGERQRVEAVAKIIWADQMRESELGIFFTKILEAAPLPSETPSSVPSTQESASVKTFSWERLKEFAGKVSMPQWASRFIT